MRLRSLRSAALLAALMLAPNAPALAQTAAATIENAAGQTLLRVDADGDVGIGTPVPLANLHVLGNSGLGKPHLFLLENDAADPHDFARLRMGQTSGATFWDLAAGGLGNDRLNIFRSGVGDVMSLQSTGRVGIGTTAPQERLDVNGAVRADRVAYRTPRTHYASISDAAFRPQFVDDFTTYQSGAGAAGAFLTDAGGGHGMAASVSLPDGARIEGFGALIYDASASYSLTCTLQRQRWTGSAVVIGTIGTVSSSGSAGYTNHTDTVNNPGDLDLVSNQNASYFIVCNAFNWVLAAPALRVHRAFVEYTLSEAQ